MRYIRLGKLEQFCLNVIIENLEKFIYSQTIPQKHIDFLLRVYSEEVFKRFSYGAYVSEDCMLWFLNPHSKKVMLTTVSEKIVSQLQIVGSKITSLSLKHLLISEDMIDAIISSVPNVVHLDLSNSRCTDNNMLCVQRMCPLLLSLNLTDCNITCFGMKNLCGIHQSLRKLDLTGTNTKPSGVYDILKGFPLLEQLRFYSMAEMLYDIHKEDLKTNAYKNIQYNLTELIYDGTGMKDILEVLHAWTVLCPYVTRVSLECGSTQEERAMCSRFKYLEVLEINAENSYINMFGDKWYGNRRFDTVNVLDPFISKGSRLTKLALTGFKISIKMLMECFKNLKTLCLEKVTFTDFLEDNLALKENKLEDLVLKQIPLDVPITCQAILSLISVSTSVTSLHLTSSRELPQNVYDAVLNSMKNLSSVHFSSFMSDCLYELGEIASLEECISGCFDDAFSDAESDRPFPPTTLPWCQWDFDSSDSDDISYKERNCS